MAPKTKLTNKKKANTVPAARPKAKRKAPAKKAAVAKREAVEPAESKLGSSSSESKIEESYGTDSQWLHAGSLPLNQRVKIKEAARVHGVQFLKDMKTHLKDHMFTFPGFPNAEMWLSEISMCYNIPYVFQ